VIFQDFPGPGILKKKNPGLSRRRGNPEVYKFLHCDKNLRLGWVLYSMAYYVRSFTVKFSNLYLTEAINVA